jgi:hypothetical protein
MLRDPGLHGGPLQRARIGSKLDTLQKDLSRSEIQA